MKEATEAQQEDLAEEAINTNIDAIEKQIEILSSPSKLGLDKNKFNECLEKWDSIFCGPTTWKEITRIDLFVGIANCLCDYVYLQKFLSRGIKNLNSPHCISLENEIPKEEISIETIADLIKVIENEEFDLERFQIKLLRLGNLLLKLSYCVLTVEGIALPKLLHSINEKNKIAIKETAYNERKRSSKIAVDARYALIREFKLKAAAVARQQWEEGSVLTHDKMVKFLIKDYVDESGKHPFETLPDGKNSQPENVLRDVVKNVAKEMNRLDLIRGIKKNK